MLDWFVYPALYAMLVSMTALTSLALNLHDRRQPKSLSQLVTAELKFLRKFRNILLICGTLFSITMFGYVIPSFKWPLALLVVWSLAYLSNAAIAFTPAADKTAFIHTKLAQLMAASFLATAYLFAFGLSGFHAQIELTLAIGMSLLSILVVVDPRRFIVYELSFIYLSHVSVLVASLALLG
ncbi:MAG TPA: hypothetical protein VFK03_03355 [Candidatus Saccharimonadales bacterium]|nr:hypothetical protein [Candidatus Saccharimonadales bacterium]